jgi:subtilisin family serine protease
MDIVIVAAAGNSSQRATIYPCQMEGVICVGAMRANGEIARFSNWGSQVDIYAPGEKILSTIPYQVTPLHLSRKGYDYKNGTSQAAPLYYCLSRPFEVCLSRRKADEIYSRLMLGADQLESGQGVRGLFSS